MRLNIKIKTHIACDCSAWEIGVGQHGEAYDVFAMHENPCKANFVRFLASFHMDWLHREREYRVLVWKTLPIRLEAVWIEWTSHPILSIACPPLSFKCSHWFAENPHRHTQHTPIFDETKRAQKNKRDAKFVCDLSLKTTNVILITHKICSRYLYIT